MTGSWKYQMNRNINVQSKTYGETKQKYKSRMRKRENNYSLLCNKPAKTLH